MKSYLSWILKSPAFRYSTGIAVSLLSLYLALRNVAFTEVGQALAQAHPGWVSLALASIALNAFSKAVRWRILLDRPGRGIPLTKLLMSHLTGQMLNTVYPGRLGELSRIYVIGGSGPGRSFTLGTILLEKLLDLAAYSLLFGVLILLIPLPAWVNSSVFTVLLLVAAAAAGAGAVAWQPEFFIRLTGFVLALLPARARLYLTGRFQSGISSLLVLRQQSSTFGLAFWTAVVWATALANNQLALLALDLHLPWTASLLVLIVLQAGISIPAVPGKIGIFEYSCILALGFFGISQGQALGFGILLHALVMLPTTLLGLVFFGMLGLEGKRAEVLNASYAPVEPPPLAGE